MKSAPASRRGRRNGAAPEERESKIRRGHGRRITTRRNRPGPAPARGAEASASGAILVVFPAADGTWSVSEEGPQKGALSYFATRLGAVRHALGTARTRMPSEVRVLDHDGTVTQTRVFDSGRGPSRFPR